MANRFYSVVLGEGLPHMVTEGAATSAEAVELRVSDTIYTKKLDVLIAIEAIEAYIQATETSPIA